MITEALLAAAPTPVPLTVGGHTFRMVPVRGGEFDMGDEVGDLYDFCRPVHRVRLDDFWIGQFPVTQALWRAVALSDVAGGNHPVTTFNPDPSFFKGDHRPVEQVSWQEIRVFLNKLNLLLLSGWNFRLPTEAEWEYAARGGHHVTLPSGEGWGGATQYAGSNHRETVAWWDKNSQGETKPVGLKPPNAFGLFDMSGNVREWCADWFDGDFYKKCTEKGEVLNPRNDEKGLYRVVRGGSWITNNPQFCRVATRDLHNPVSHPHFIGFRLAASPSSSVISA